ncbi:MAG: hypothetical protein MN733_19775, partial [Nitrososphaera sp.]|nr:hypothetical protein [Nitrososphaera sp.]
ARGFLGNEMSMIVRSFLYCLCTSIIVSFALSLNSPGWLLVVVALMAAALAPYWPKDRRFKA